MESNNNQVTVKDVLVDVLSTLSSIKIDMAQFEELGVPLKRSINGIQVCLNAMEQAAQQPEEEHQLSVVSEEENKPKEEDEAYEEDQLEGTAKE